MLTASSETEGAATSARQHDMAAEAKADEAEAEGGTATERESKPSEEEDKENLTENSDAQNPKDDEPAEDDLCTLWVGQLHKNVTEEILYELFLQAGPIMSARIPNDKEGKRRTFGFVEYVYDVSVPYAMALFEGTKLFGREIRMNSKNPERVNMEKIRRDMALMIHQNQRQKLAASMNNPQPYVDAAPPRLIPEATIPRPLLPCPPPLQKLPLLPLPLLDNCQRPRPLLDNGNWQAPQLGRGLMGPYPGAMGLRNLMDVGPNGETWPPLMFQPRPRETNAPSFLLRPGPCAASGPSDRSAAARASCVTRPLLTQRSAQYNDDPRRYMDTSASKADRRGASGSARPILSVKVESSDKDEQQSRNGEGVHSNSVPDTEKSDTVVTKDCGNTKSNCSDLENVCKDDKKENDDTKRSVVVKLKDDNVITVSISCDVQNFKDAKIKLEKVEIEDLDEVESQDKIDKLKKVQKSVQLENFKNIEKTVKVENSGKQNKILTYNSVSDDDSKTEAKKDRDINRFYDGKRVYDPSLSKEEKDFTPTTRIDVKSAVYSNSAYKATESMHEVDRPGMTLKGKAEENGKEKAFIRWADRLLESQGKTPDGGFVFRKSPSDRSVVDVAKSGDVPSSHSPQKTPVDHPLQLLNSSLQSSLCDGNKKIDPIQAFVKMAESNKLKQMENNSVCLQDPKPIPVFGKAVNNNTEQGKIDRVTGSKSSKLNDVSEQVKCRDVSVIKSSPAVAEVGRMKTYSQVLNSNEATKAESGVKSYSQVASKPPADKMLLTRDPQRPKQILGASGEGGKMAEGRDSGLLWKANSNVLRDVKLFKDKLNHSNKDGSLVSKQPVINATEKSHMALEDMKKEPEFPKSPPPFFRGADYAAPKQSYSLGDPCGIIDEIMRQGRPVEVITDCGGVRYPNQGCRPTNKFVTARPACDMRRDATTKVYGGADLYPPAKSAAAAAVLESGSCVGGVGRDGVCHLGRGRGRGQSRCMGQATLQGPCRRPAAPPPAPGYRR